MDLSIATIALSPDLNPLGGPSIVALVWCALVILLVSDQSPLPQTIRNILLFPVPVLLVVFGKLAAMNIYSDADEFSAQIIYWSVAFGCSLHMQRAEWRILRWFGTFFSWIVAILLVVIPFGYVSQIFSSTAAGPEALLGIIVAIIWCPLSIVRLKMLRERTLVQQGRCSRCGYDLRGMEGRAECPECGGSVEQAAEIASTHSISGS